MTYRYEIEKVSNKPSMTDRTEDNHPKPLMSTMRFLIHCFRGDEPPGNNRKRLFIDYVNIDSNKQTNTLCNLVYQ